MDHSDHYPALLLLRRRELGRLRLWWLWLQQQLRRWLWLCSLLLIIHKLKTALRAQQGTERIVISLIVRHGKRAFSLTRFLSRDRI